MDSTTCRLVFGSVIALHDVWRVPTTSNGIIALVIAAIMVWWLSTCSFFHDHFCIQTLSNPSSREMARAAAATLRPFWSRGSPPMSPCRVWSACRTSTSPCMRWVSPLSLNLWWSHGDSRLILSLQYSTTLDSNRMTWDNKRGWTIPRQVIESMPLVLWMTCVAVLQGKEYQSASYHIHTTGKERR